MGLPGYTRKRGCPGTVPDQPRYGRPVIGRAVWGDLYGRYAMTQLLPKLISAWVHAWPLSWFLRGAGRLVSLRKTRAPCRHDTRGLPTFQ